MKKYLIPILATVLSLTLSVVSGANAGRLTVVASVFPLYDFAREVAGPEADVRLLLPPGVDPHSWEPRPSDIVLLSDADIFLYTSARMEPWAAPFVNTVRKKFIIFVDIMDTLGFGSADERYGSSGVVSGGDDHSDDPHFWLNLSLSARAVELIGRSLSETNPENAGHFRSNASSYAAKLRKLDEKYMDGLGNCRTRQLVTGGHSAFGHLARRYGLEQISVYGLSPDAEPSPKHLAGIIKVVRESGVQTVFSEELMNPKMTEVLSQETGANIMPLNPAGNLSAEQWQRGITFLDIMENNLAALKEGLYCE